MKHLRWFILILLGLAVYHQTFGYGFVFDDNYFILNTPYIKSFDKLNQIWDVLPMTRMIGVYSFALNYWIGQADPRGYHIFNFLVHLLATALVWATASKLFKIAGEKPYEFPYIIALLFLVHPCQTQAVTYISQRFESIATVFYLSSFYAYLCARTSSERVHQVSLFTGAAVFAVLGLLTKEVAVTIPMMIVAAEYILFNRKPYWPIILLGGIFVFVFMKIVHTDFVSIYFRFSSPSGSHDGDVITGGKYVLTQMRVFLTFLRLLIFPVNQNLDYDYPLSTGLLSPPLTLAGLALIGFISCLIFKLRKKWPLIAFGLAWILITFSINTAPRANLIFEHKLYLISFGFLLAFVCALSVLIKERKILYVFLIVLLAILSVASYKRNQVWKNELTLWSDVLQKSPHKARPYEGQGIAYGMQGNLIQALLDFNKALELHPNYAEAYGNRGNTYSKLGFNNLALDDYNKAISLSPYYADAYFNRGALYAKRGDFAQALSDFNQTIRINPQYEGAIAYRNSITPDIFYNRGLSLALKGDFAGAMSDFNIAIDISPDYVKAYINRGNIFGRQGDFIRALTDFNKAIEIDPQSAEAYTNRGTLFAQRGNFSQAMSDYDRAVTIHPGNQEVYFNRAVIHFQLKEYEKAWDDVKKVEALGSDVNPQFISALRKASAK